MVSLNLVPRVLSLLSRSRERTLGTRLGQSLHILMFMTIVTHKTTRFSTQILLGIFAAQAILTGVPLMLLNQPKLCLATQRD